jgi:PadR family transcriptional regulator PadR
MNKSYIKGFLEDIVLHLIDEQGESYGYELTRLVEERTKGIIKINEGALYPVLHKLEQKGVITGSFRLIDNRPRKYYRIAASNLKNVAQNKAEAQVYISALKTLLN